MSRIPAAKNACYPWAEFADDFRQYWHERFGDVTPTAAQVSSGTRDWQAGNTGWEAVENAWRREKDRQIKDSRPPLVHLGGRNYAYAGPIESATDTGGAA